MVRIALIVFWDMGQRENNISCFGAWHIKKKSFKVDFLFFQQINAELLFRTPPGSGQSFSPVKESVPRGHLSEVANTYATRLINNHRSSPQSEPESNKSVAKMCFSSGE